MFIVFKSIESGGLSNERELPDGDAVITIGRSPDSGIVLGDVRVSRRHARIIKSGNCVSIEDTKSASGVFVNGARISEITALSSSDTVRIAAFEMVLAESAASAEVRAKDAADNAQNSEKEIRAPRSQRQADAATQKANAPVNSFLDEFKNASVLYSPEIMELKHKIHEDILEKLNLTSDSGKISGETMIEKLNLTLDKILKERLHELPRNIEFNLFRQAILDEITEFGPITPLLRSPRVSEIMINGPDCIFIESGGKLFESGVRFFNEQHLVSIIQRIVEPLGRHIDDASPMVDARLPDGSRVNAVIPPLALDGASVTIRKFADKKLTTEDLIGFGSMTAEMAKFLQEAVRSRQNILVSGGTGSGKTTLLNVLSQFIPEGERVITIEDSAELKLSHKNIVRLEARPANIEGKGKISIRDLVVNTLRMRPDRIIVGECRGAEALDMLQAMNTGHDGSLTTCHANNPRDALARLENMVMMAGYDLPSSAIREQIASAINLIVQQSRLSDGSRKIVKISEVTGREGDVILMQDIFTYEQTDIASGGKVEGYHTASGNIPYFIDELRKAGSLRLDMGVFVPRN